MTREEALELIYTNRDIQVTTDKLLNNGYCVYCDRHGYFMFSNGEEIVNTEELEEDGWFDCSDIEFEEHNVDDLTNFMFNDDYW